MFFELDPVIPDTAITETKKKTKYLHKYLYMFI